jgi:hypothetical protein
MKVIKKHNKNKWDEDELERYYTAAIIDRKSKSNILSRSSKKRTWSSITTKLWKVYGVLQRTDEDGETYLYLADGVPSIISRKRTSVESKVITEVKYPSELPLPPINYEARLQTLYKLIGEKEMEVQDLKSLAHRYRVAIS